MHENASFFVSPLMPEEHGVSNSEYDSIVKQPMDLTRIKAQLEKVDPKTGKSYYSGAQEFSKDVNRIFSNVAKVWNMDTEIGKQSGMLQGWWVNKWMQMVSGGRD